MIDDIVHAVAECGGDACSVQGTALLLHAVSARVSAFFHKQKCRFPGRDRGVIGRFFAAIGGAKFLLFFARSFLTQEELYPL